MDHRRKLHFDEKKSTQLASIFLKLRGNRMKHLKLIKLMYLTDREAFKRWGHPITGDFYFSMENGPVLSNVLDLIGSEPLPNRKSEWLDSIRVTSNHDVELLNDPGNNCLSDAEVELATEIFEEYGYKNRWVIVDFTHTFPEYKQTDKENRRLPIEYEDLLKAVGKTPEEAHQICEFLFSVSKAKSLLSL